MTIDFWRHAVYFAALGAGVTLLPAQQPERGPLAPVAALLPPRALRSNCASFVDSSSASHDRRFLCEGDRPLYSVLIDTTGAIRVIGYGGALGAHARADSIVARLSRAFGRPRRCGRDDWQWQIPEGEINVKFDPSTIPDQGKMVWYLGILAQWRELRLSRGGEWTPNVALQLPSAQSTGLCAW